MEANVVVGLGVAAAGVAAFFVWLPFARHRLHRAQQVHDAGPETMELRDEPPALVNLLVNELHITGDAVAATILDLAARHHVEIVELSPEENLVIPKRHDRDPLTSYEDRLLQVVEHAAASAPHATVPAIADALGPSSAGTWLQFAAEVTRDARRRGLTTSPATGSETKALLLLALLPCAGVLIAAPLAYAVTPFLYVALLLAGVLLLVIGRTSILTGAGRAAAKEWIGVSRFIEHHGSFDDLPPGAVAVWDRYLAYGAAMGLSSVAVHGLVNELRTTVSVTDVGFTVASLSKAVRAQHDPDKQRLWRGEQLSSLFGPDADPDAIYGPEQGSFWRLLDATGQTWRLATLSRRADAEMWKRATLARIDSLVSASPPELAPDVAIVARAARRAVTIISRAGDARPDSLTSDPTVTSAEVRAALDRVTAAVAAHLGLEPTTTAVVESLVGGTLNLESLMS